MNSNAYIQRRSQLTDYFDRTAVEAWKKLTSDAPVSKIRATVRAGRDRMRNTMLSYLPEDLSGARILDAGCGTGAMSVELAKRGANVLAIDLSPTLIQLAEERLPHDIEDGHIEFRAGDMLDPTTGTFDYVVAMDSMIHYATEDLVDMLAGLTHRTGKGVIFTHAPWTPALACMHTVGRLFPRANRAPAIVPVAHKKLHQLMAEAPAMSGWSLGRHDQINSGFYMSRAQELVRR